MGRLVSLLHISAGKQFCNTFKNGKKSETYILAGRTAVHDECGLQCARCFYLRLTKKQPFREGGNNLRK